MRSPGELVQLLPETMEFCAKMYPKKNENQRRGFALDILEKHVYTICFEGWTPGDSFAPYDIRGHDLYVDFKLCSKSTVTISASECAFGDKNNYFLFIYTLDKNPNIAVFQGGISYKDISKHLQLSQFDDGKFAWLSDIRPLLV